MRRSITYIGLAVALAAGLTAVALGASDHRSSWGPRSHARTVRLSTFHRTARLTAVQRKQRAEIRREFRRAPRGSAIASAAFDAAQTVRIPGTQTDAWIAPDAGGGACTFIDDPLGGYGSACATPDAIANGQAATILLVGTGSPLSGKALVALAEPDGADAPVVHRPDGSTDDLPVANNLATGVADPGDTIWSGANRIIVPQPRDHACAEPDPGATFRRCT